MRVISFKFKFKRFEFKPRKMMWTKYYSGINISIDSEGIRPKFSFQVRFDMNRGKSKVQANHLACIDTSRRFSAGQILAGSRIAAHFKSEG